LTSRTAGDGSPEKATQKRASRIAAINLPGLIVINLLH